MLVLRGRSPLSLLVAYSHFLLRLRDQTWVPLLLYPGPVTVMLRFTWAVLRKLGLEKFNVWK